jgi:hypothetical protein
MELTQALVIIQREILAKTGKSLTEVEEAVFTGAWEGETYEEIAVRYGYTTNYLKNDAGPNFWKLLTNQVFQEKVSKANIRAILERKIAARSLEKSNINLQPYINPKTPKPKIDWGEAPNLTSFYGRDSELKELEEWIVKDKTQLVLILGLKGVGKTALAVKIVEEMKDEFDCIIWRSLHRNPPLVTDLLSDLIKSLSNQQKPNLPTKLHELISLLIEYLRKSRCLLVLDGVECIIEEHSLPEKYRQGYEGYGELFSRIGSARHNSCLLLTSQKSPQEVIQLEVTNLPCKLLSVSGLLEADASQLLSAKRLAETDPDSWEILIKIFQGNPLALQIISSRIKLFFGGEVSNFLKQQTITIGEIFELVNQQFDSLSDLEKEIMYHLAIGERPLSFTQLKQKIEKPGSEILNAVESLLRRSLISGEREFEINDIWKDIAREFNPQKSSLDSSQAQNNIREYLNEIFYKS